MNDKLKDKIKKYKQKFDTDDEGIARYLEDYQNKLPKVNIHYVGLEIECFSKISRISLQKLFFKYDLEEFVMIGDDGTITPVPLDHNGTPIHESDEIFHTFELRLLIPQLDLSSILKRFGRVFRMARLKTNESCGLHVHLDMRNRDVDGCFEKLLNFQDVLFAIVNKDRWNNSYCRQTSIMDRRHYMGINRLAYAEHQTIEIRMHHGCVDTDQIEKWTRLLINVIQSKNVPKITSKKTALEWRGLNKKLRHYVRRNFKEEWFDEKEEFEY